MMLFGWKELEWARREYAGGLFQWVPWIEQLEMFPDRLLKDVGLAQTGTDSILDSESSVSGHGGRRRI